MAVADDEPQSTGADWNFTHAEMLAHDAALLATKPELMVDDEDRVMGWLASSSAARIARVVACGQKLLDERFADGVFE